MTAINKWDMDSPWDDIVDNLTPHDADEYTDRLDIADARESLLDFITYTKPNYVVNWHHRLICESIDDFLVNPDRRYMMIFVGPRRGKSEIISRRLPAYYFGKNPDKKIIATSYGADLSAALNREVQRIIDSPIYHKVFPDTTLSASNVRTTAKKNYVRTSDRFEIVGHEGYYRSAGVGGGITGMGFDLGIIDDPIKNSKEAQSSTTKKAIWEWYDTTFSTRGMPGHKIILILTRWATDDLAGMLLEQAEKNPDAPQWEVLCFPEMFDQDHPWAHPDDPREEDGEVLWPGVFPEPEVKARKASSTAKTWNSLFQQLPAPDEGVIFRREYFKYYKELPEIQYKVLSVDCSFKENNDSDYVSMGVWGVVGPNKYLLHRVKKRLDLPNTIKEILIIHRMFPDIRMTLVEDKANGPAVISTLKSRIPAMIPFQPLESKVARANATTPQFEGGNVWLPDPYYGPNRTERPWCVEGVDEYVTELCTFPYAPNDDDVDMTTQVLLKLGDGGNWVDEFIQGKGKEAPPTKEEKFTDDLAEMMGWDITKQDDRYGF